MLFPQIAVRQTNKSVYSGKEIPEDSINKLKNISIDPSVSIYFYKRGSVDYERIADWVYAGNSLQMNDEAFKTELTKWMRYNKRHQNKTRDGLSYATFGAPNVPLFLAKFIMSMAINEKTQNKGDRKKIASASHMVLFTTKDNTVEQWVTLGRTLERILLRSTQMGIVNAYLNQPNEESNIAKEMASQLQIANEYPTILIRLGYVRKMPYSLFLFFLSCFLPVFFSVVFFLVFVFFFSSFSLSCCVFILLVFSPFLFFFPFFFHSFHFFLFFSLFPSLLYFIGNRFEEEKITSYMITGATPKDKRLQLVNKFNNDDTNVFLISLKAGGTGLNLTGADIVIHYDPWWNFAAQNQATDRAHRIGQKNTVTVYRLIAKGTIEEKIVKLQESKKDLADRVLNFEEGMSLSNISKEELLELLG